MKLVSVVVPLFNEAANVRPLLRELRQMAEGAEFDCEFVFVDDGSQDETCNILREEAGADSRIRVVVFRRNFGQTAAMAAGLDYARGEIVVTLDGDLQNDPAEIPRMIKKLDEGFDLVAGWRKNRKDAMLSRKLPSLIANKIISKTTNVNLHDYGCTLKVMKRDVAKSINLYGEMHRFIPALAAESGVKIAELPVNHRPRVAGRSKYGISRTFRVLLDLLTVKFFLGFSTRPIHMFGGLGMLSGGLGGIILLYLAYERIFLSQAIGNRPMLLLGAMLVLIGLQFVCFGLMAEILVRTYHESQNKKIYAVREVISVGDNEKTQECARSEEMRRVVGVM
ncbi:MAG: glycosyltransferase family 2 protein [Deltaproteobacteria bacterium]|nr:glycosyltransferase family 2 protein [Deltaproteobacteria bacterium]